METLVVLTSPILLIPPNSQIQVGLSNCQLPTTLYIDLGESACAQHI